MKKTKILTVLSVLVAMGLTGCKTGNKSSAEKSATPSASVSASNQPSASANPSASASSSSSAFNPAATPDGHKFGADADVAADAEKGTVAYKKATCSDNDGFLRFKVNKEAFSLVGSSKWKSSPDGYAKLNSDNNAFSFKMEADKAYQGKLYLFGCMDGWSTEGNRNAGFYRGGNPSAEITVNGKALDASAQSEKTYRDYFGEDQVDTELSSPSDHLSVDGYAPFAAVTLQKGVNEIVYTRKQTQNMLIKDMVFIVEEAPEWGAAQDVAANTERGTVAYKKYANNFNDSIKLEVLLNDSMLAEGSVNKNDPAGYFKLKGNDQSFSFKFDYDSIAYGDIYQRGVMDGWSTNKSRKLFSGGANGADDFEIVVNEKKVVVDPEQKKLSFEQAMPGEAQEGDLSAISDVRTGAVMLKNGVNEFTYTRKASFNLALTHIVFIVENSDHIHAAAENAEWQKDADYHWHVCGTENCNEIVDKAEHEWVDDETVPAEPSTCTVAGHKTQKCSVCGQTREVALPLGEHAWGDAQTQVAGAIPHECNECHAKCYELTMANTSNNVAAQKLKTDAKWDITGIDAGTYEVQLYACAAATTLSQNIVDNGVGRYQFKVGAGEYVNPNSGTYGSFGLGTGESAANCKWSKPLAQVTVAADSTEFTIHWTDKGYSAFINGARLVKVA